MNVPKVTFCGSLPQIAPACPKLHQLAAYCTILPQIAPACHKLWQFACVYHNVAQLGVQNAKKHQQIGAIICSHNAKKILLLWCITELGQT